MDVFRIVSRHNVIVMFHTLPSCEWFRRTLRVLQRHYHFVCMEEIESYYYEEVPLTNGCHVCFDDGHRSFHEKALPVLREMNVPATLFISPYIVKNGVNYWFQRINDISDQIGQTALRTPVKIKVPSLGQCCCKGSKR